MADLNKHQQKTEKTRKKLLNAALRVFSRDGFERSRLEDIAVAAGHTRGALYANFASKEDLFMALLEHHASQRAAEISKALEGKTSSTECWDAIRAYYLGGTKDRRWAILMLEFKLYAIRHSEHGAKFAAAHRRIRASFHLEVANAMRYSSALGPKAEQHAKILLEVVRGGLLLEQAYDPKRVSSREVNDLLSRMFDFVTVNNSEPLSD